VRRRNREVVDVQFVKDSPERTESHNVAVGAPGEIEVRDAVIVEFGEIHLARPRTRKRRLLDGEHGIDLVT